MRIVGFALMALGALIAIFAFTLDTTVANPGDYLSGRTHNLGLLQQQMMVLQTGLSMFVAGSFFAARSADSVTTDASTTASLGSDGIDVAFRPSPETEALGWSSLGIAALLLGGGAVLVFVLILAR